MNLQQQKYALQRVEEIFHSKKSKLHKIHHTEAISISEEEKMKLIKSGKVKMCTGLKKVPYYTSELFDYSKYEKPAKTNTVQLTVAMDKLQAKYNEVRDEIVLGDEEKALKLIQSFSK